MITDLFGARKAWARAYSGLAVVAIVGLLLGPLAHLEHHHGDEGSFASSLRSAGSSLAVTLGPSCADHAEHSESRYAAPCNLCRSLTQDKSVIGLYEVAVVDPVQRPSGLPIANATQDPSVLASLHHGSRAPPVL